MIIYTFENKLTGETLNIRSKDEAAAWQILKEIYKDTSNYLLIYDNE